MEHKVAELAGSLTRRCRQLTLVYCFTLGDTFSESLAGQMQGALAQE